MANREAERKAAKQIKNTHPNSENLKTLEYFRDLIVICQVSRCQPTRSHLFFRSPIAWPLSYDSLRVQHSQTATPTPRALTLR